MREARKKDDLVVLIATDFEGISEVNDIYQVLYGYETFERARIWMTEDVNATIRGLRAAGAGEIRVVDGHGSGGPNKNILSDRLERDVNLFQDPMLYKRLLNALDRSVDAIALVGYHAMADTPDGFMSHTLTLEPRVRINGRPVGETFLTAGWGGYYGIPTILVTGDQALVREASNLIPGIETTQVKASPNRQTSYCLPGSRARSMIERSAELALKKLPNLRPLRVEKPIDVELTLPTVDLADFIEMIPRSQRLTDKSVSYLADEYPEAMAFLTVAITLLEQKRGESLMKKVQKLKGYEDMEKHWLEDLFREWISARPSPQEK